MRIMYLPEQMLRAMTSSTSAAGCGAPTVTVKHQHGADCVMANDDPTADLSAWDGDAVTDHNLDNWDGTTDAGPPLADVVIKPTGSNDEFDNRGPWAAVKWIIKT